MEKDEALGKLNSSIVRRRTRDRFHWSVREAGVGRVGGCSARDARWAARASSARRAGLEPNRPDPGSSCPRRTHNPYRGLTLRRAASREPWSRHDELGVLLASEDVGTACRRRSRTRRALQKPASGTASAAPCRSRPLALAALITCETRPRVLGARRATLSSVLERASPIGSRASQAARSRSSPGSGARPEVRSCDRSTSQSVARCRSSSRPGAVSAYDQKAVDSRRRDQR